MNCQDVNSRGTRNLINDSIIAKENLPNFVLFYHFWNHTANSGVGLKI